jgi:hypothetical protein
MTPPCRRHHTGTAAIYVKADPEVSVDLTTCVAEVATPGIWQFGMGLDNTAEGWQWLTNWLSGKFHAVRSHVPLIICFGYVIMTMSVSDRVLLSMMVSVTFTSSLSASSPSTTTTSRSIASDQPPSAPGLPA